MIGEVVLHLMGHDRRIEGGPFDNFVAPAISLCLEARAARVAEATLVLPIEDFQAPSQENLINGLRALLLAMRVQPDAPVYIGCRAGIGRTGMVIACLAKLAGVDDPVGWTRAHYHPDAMETEAQRAAVAALDVDGLRS